MSKTDSSSTSKPKSQFILLEGLRGIAALGVVLNHARGTLFVGGHKYLENLADPTVFDYLAIALLQITSLGPQCVIAFFVLSGFSIAHSVYKMNSLAKFYLRRIIRLYPPYLLGILFAAFTYWVFSEYSIQIGSKPLRFVFDSSESVLRNLTYLNIGSFIDQYWSLKYEVLFYLIAPLVATRLSSNYFLYLSTALYGASFLLQAPKGLLLKPLYSFWFEYSIFFALGMWLYHHKQQAETLLSPLLERWPRVISSLVLGTIIVLRFSFKISLFFSALTSIIAILAIIKYRISSSWSLKLGAISYTLYISHIASIYLTGALLIKLGWVSELPNDNLLLWVVAVPTSILFAQGLYYLAEAPSIRLVKKLRPKLAQKE